ncbi:MAG: RNase P modulator RnpM [Bacillota bacterium]
MPRVKKVPQRMCVGCQEMKPKKELIRVVRTPDENIEVDPTGKKSGRGAYICPQVECLQRAFKEKRLERALERAVSREIYDLLVQRLKG